MKAWRKIPLPRHQGPADLIRQVELAGMHVEMWARAVILACPFAPRSTPSSFNVIRLPMTQLGFKPGQLVSIQQTKSRGVAWGLGLLDYEKTLALRLAYADQPFEWMRVAVETFVDKDNSYLDMAIVNDSSRLDVRTTWAFPGNQYQVEHEWFWEN